jgi:hypothetical protein
VLCCVLVSDAESNLLLMPPKHVAVDVYNAYVFVCASYWPYKRNHISLHGMNNIKIPGRSSEGVAHYE